jgi:hypothetical protein
VTGLTAADRDLVRRAREVAGLRGAAVRERTGERDLGMAMATAFGEAQHLLGALAAIIERAAAEAEDTRRLGEIRALLTAFDWEHDDRQYALEAIGRIADGGQP